MDSHFKTRRRLITGILTLPVLPFCFAGTKGDAGSRPITVINHWKTDNHTLFPFSCEGKNLYLNGNATLEAWDIAAGKQQWIAKLPAPAHFRPRYGKDIVISAGRNLLAGFQKRDGRPVWVYKPSGKLAVPFVSDQRVFIGEENHLLALDLKTGVKLWSYPIADNARIAYAPIESDGVVYFGPGDGTLCAIDAGDGTVLWRIDREKDWQYLRQLHISNGILVAGGYHDELFGIRLSDGEIIWRFYAGNFINSHHVADGKVFFWSPTGWVYALDSANGKILWRHRTKDFGLRRAFSNWAPIMAELVSDRLRLYALAMDSVLHVLEPETGNKLGEYPIPESVRPFICIEPGSGNLLLGSNQGEILLASID